MKQKKRNRNSSVDSYNWVDIYNLIMEKRLEQVGEILNTFPETYREQVITTAIESALLNGGIDLENAIKLLTKYLGGDYGKKFEDKLWITYPNFSDKHFNHRPR